MRVERVTWSDWAERRLYRALHGDVDFIRSEVQNGVSRLFQMSHDDDSTSFFITRVEGRELVIVAFAGTQYVEALTHIRAAAIAHGFETMRGHTKSLAILRLLKAFDSELIEYTARFFIHGR